MLYVIAAYLAQDALSVEKRFFDFAHAHKVLSVQVEVSGQVGAGKGSLIIRYGPKGKGTKVDWRCNIGGAPFHYVSDGRMGVDVFADHVYDRVPSSFRPMPAGRYHHVPGFPYALALQDIRQLLGPVSGVKLAKVGDLDELSSTARTVQGVQTTVADINSQGELVRFSEELGTGRSIAEELRFSDYRFDSAAFPSKFNSSPPLGYTPYAFDLPPLPVTKGFRLPAVPLVGPSKTDLAALMSPDLALIAFVDNPLPRGLADALARIRHKMPVTIIALNGSVKLKGFLCYSAGEIAFDDAGIQATPQFYLVGKGKVIQPFVGFDPVHQGQLESEISTAMTKPGTHT